MAPVSNPASAAVRLAFTAAIFGALCVLAFGAQTAKAATGYGNTGFFSGPGSEDGQLSTPARAAVEQSTGNLFVVDSANDRVQVFKPNGSGTADYLTQFGAGELSAPWGIAIDEDAGQTNVYVADAGNGRIVKYDSDEGAVPSFVENGAFDETGDGHIGDFHAALAIDPTTHDLLVADHGDNLIERLGSDGSFDSSFDGSAGAGSPGAFAGLLDVAVSSTGDVYVIDSNGAIAAQEGTSQALRYSATGEYKATLLPVGSNQRPATVTVDRSSDQVVVSGEQDAVYRDQYPTLHVFDPADAPLQELTLSNAQWGTVSGLAPVFSSQRLYAVTDVGDYFGSLFGAPTIQVLEAAALPDVSIDLVAGVTPEGASLSGGVNPNGISTSWRFEYSRDGSTWVSAPQPAGDAGAGTTEVDVSVDLTGLQPNTAYQVRLVADGDLRRTSPTLSFTTGAVAPVVTTDVAGGLASNQARVSASINSRNAATTYYFEYGTDSSYGAKAPLTGADAGEGGNAVYVFSHLPGLAPQTEYHYRVVASNAAGVSEGQDRTFTTRPAPPQRPARAFEMVSPPDKNGGDVMTETTRTRVSADGNAVQWASTTAFGDDVLGTGAPGADYISKRTASGWKTHSLTPLQTAPRAAAPQRFSNYVGNFSPGLDRGIFYAMTPVTSAGPNAADVSNLYLRNDLLSPGAGSYRLLSDSVSALPPEEQGGFEKGITLVGNSDDFSHVFFESPNNLTGETTGNYPKLFEWFDGEVRLAGVLPDGTPSPVSFAGTSAGGGYAVGGPSDPLADYSPKGFYTADTVSADGSRVVFTGPRAANLVGGALDRHGVSGTLYLREAGTTLQLNESERSVPDPAGPSPARFQGASADNSRIYFSTTEALVDADTDGVQDLYLYEVEKPAGARLTLVSVDQSPGDVDSAGDPLPHIEEFFGASKDGEYIYFSSRNNLVPGLPVEGNPQPRVYAWHDGDLRLVTVKDGYEFDSNWSGEVENGSTNSPSGKTFRITADGQTVAFATGSTRAARDAVASEKCGGGRGCQQVYVYSYAEDRLECASCRPDGEPSSATADYTETAKFGAVNFATQHLNSPLTEDGGRVFFTTAAALVSKDSNGRRDVYEFDFKSGQLHLVTSGQSSQDSYFVEASPDGKDVLFTTAQQLVAIDRDQSYDLYDARAGGGIAAQNAVEALSCEGEACQSASQKPPVGELPATGNAGHAQAGKARRNCALPRRKMKRAKATLDKAAGKRAVGKEKKKLRAARTKLEQCQRGGRK